ncbi:hypothetical protein D3C87_1648820 [compost metagenome]
MIKFGCALTYVAPCLEQGQYHSCQTAISIQQRFHICIKYPAVPFGHDETKRFKEATYLVAELLGNAYELATCCHQCARHHVVEGLYSHDFVKSGFGQLR